MRYDVFWGVILRKPTFQLVSECLLDAAVEPSLWADAMKSVADFADAAGASLLKTKGRSPGSPHTRSMDEAFSTYFREGWHLRDERERGLPFVKAQGTYVDQDFASEHELRYSDYYRGFLAKYEANWSAGVGFSSKEDEWCLVASRGDRQGYFEADEQRNLKRLGPVLGQAALLSNSISYASLNGLLDAYQSLKHPAVVVSQQGKMLLANVEAEAMFSRIDSGITARGGQLSCPDLISHSLLQALISKISCRNASSGITSVAIRRPSQHPIVAQGFTLSGIARSVFHSGRAILLFTDLEKRQSLSNASELSELFGFTKVESRLVEILLSGATLKEASDKMEIAYETTRSHIKSAFSKTHTERQSELFNLIQRIPVIK